MAAPLPALLAPAAAAPAPPVPALLVLVLVLVLVPELPALPALPVDVLPPGAVEPAVAGLLEPAPPLLLWDGDCPAVEVACVSSLGAGVFSALHAASASAVLKKKTFVSVDIA